MSTGAWKDVKFLSLLLLLIAACAAIATFGTGISMLIDYGGVVGGSLGGGIIAFAALLIVAGLAFAVVASFTVVSRIG